MKYIKIKHIQTKYMIYINDEPIGPLYQSDVNNLELSDESEISDEKAEKVIDCVYRRASNYIMNLLEKSEIAVNDVRFKLKYKCFNDDITERVISMLYDYNYLNDERYAEVYTRKYCSQKSRNMIVRELKQKGIDSPEAVNIVDEIFAQEEVDEGEIVRKLIEKKYGNPDLSDEKTRMKVMSYLARRGFRLKDEFLFD